MNAILYLLNFNGMFVLLLSIWGNALLFVWINITNDALIRSLVYIYGNCVTILANAPMTFGALKAVYFQKLLQS